MCVCAAVMDSDFQGIACLNPSIPYIPAALLSIRNSIKTGWTRVVKCCGQEKVVHMTYSGPCCPSHWPCFSVHQSQKRRWCPCGKFHCLEGAEGHIWSKDKRRIRWGLLWVYWVGSLPGPLIPSGAADTWGYGHIWGKIRTGRGQVVWWALVGTGRSTTAWGDAGQAQYTRCSSSGWQCRRDSGQTPSCPSFVALTVFHLSCPESPAQGKWEIVDCSRQISRTWLSTQTQVSSSKHNIN